MTTALRKTSHERDLRCASGEGQLILGNRVAAPHEEAPVSREPGECNRPTDLYSGGFLAERPKGPGERLARSEEHTSELQSQSNLVCRLLLEKKKKNNIKKKQAQIKSTNIT